MKDAEQAALERKVIDAIQQALAGSEFAPPDGGIITDAVVIMGWVTPDDAGDGTSHIRCGSPWGTEGLIVDALRTITEQEKVLARARFEDE